MERERRKADRDWEEIRTAIGDCRNEPTRECLDLARRALSGLMSRDARGMTDLEAIDTLGRLTNLVDSIPFNFDELTWVRILSRADFPRQAEYLDRLAAVPNPQSRKEAVEALRKLGLRPRSMPPLEPVTFVFTSLGKPFPDGSMTLGMPCSPTAPECPSWGWSNSIQGSSYPVDRKAYLHAHHISGRLRFFNEYPGSDDFRDSRLFSVTVPLQERPDGPVRVEVPLRRREYHLEFPQGFEPDLSKEMRVLIRRQDPHDPVTAFPASMRLRRKLVLPALGDGVYSLAVAIPGLQTWEAESLVVGEDAMDTIRFRKGADLQYRIRGARESNIRVPVSVELRHGVSGAVRRDALSRLDNPMGPGLGDWDRFRGLPPGVYTLELSSRPDTSLGAKAVRAVRTFTVGKDSPDLIRLGEIRLR